MKKSRVTTLVCFWLLRVTISSADCTPDSRRAPANILPLAALDASCGLLNPSPNEVKAIVKSYLATQLNSTNRQLYFYHYGTQYTPVPSETTQNGNYGEKIFVHASSSYFGNHDQHGGLYTAPDPIMSLDFSEDPGLLLRVGVPPGTKYLNLRDDPPSDSVTKVWCYLRSLCTTDACKEFQNEIINQDHRASTWSPDYFVATSQVSSDLLKEIYKELGIQFTTDPYRDSPYKSCPKAAGIEAVFIDPDFASQLTFAVLTPNPKSISVKNKSIYNEVLSDFDAVQFNREDPDLNENVKARFWQYYKSWAPTLHNVAKAADLVALQSELSMDPIKTRQATSKLFGCSNNPDFQIESR